MLEQLSSYILKSNFLKFLSFGIFSFCCRQNALRFSSESVRVLQHCGSINAVTFTHRAP